MAVLVAYVPTPEGFAAFEAGLTEAALRAATLVVVNVVLNGNFAEVTAADEQHLDAVESRLTEAGVGHQIVQVTDARDVSDEVIGAAERAGADLIVVGLHRRSAVGKALLGSNAQRIILGAPCPVLSVRPN